MVEQKNIIAVLMHTTPSKCYYGTRSIIIINIHLPLGYMSAKSSNRLVCMCPQFKVFRLMGVRREKSSSERKWFAPVSPVQVNKN